MAYRSPVKGYKSPRRYRPAKLSRHYPSANPHRYTRQGDEMCCTCSLRWAVGDEDPHTGKG